MKLKIKTRGVTVNHELRTEIDQRIRAGLSRFVHTVRRVDLTVTDINGPRGGVDKVVRLQVAGHGFLPVLIEQSDREIGRAVSFAVDRASRTLVRALERARLVASPVHG